LVAGLNDNCFHKIKVPFKKEFKKIVHNNYIQKTKDKLSKLTDNDSLINGFIILVFIRTKYIIT
jgi:hypothetical protein